MRKGAIKPLSDYRFYVQHRHQTRPPALNAGRYWR
nr:MAG TPA: hypothetical protein [Caudoviricetes sp.]